MLKPIFLNVVFFILLSFSLKIDVYSQAKSSSGPEDLWVDSVFNSLSPDERIAQLMVVRANVPWKAYSSEVDKYIKEYNIGGVTFFGGEASRQAIQTNEWQGMAKTPLLISIDAEWGLGMRLDSTMKFPFQMTLGAIRDDSLIYLMGKEIGRQCKRMGIQMNFAPVVDINSNPANPVIHMRSFGENKELVARKGLMYMKGLQDMGIIATAKHFPGHGDTDSDSHLTLPLIKHSKARLDSMELYPFKKLIENGLGGIMVAHLYIPSLEKKKHTPTTLSKSVITGLLKNELGFKGLVVTDALDMKGVTKNDKPGDIEVKALEAGNDILLLSASVPEAIKKIRKAIRKGDLSEDLINERCRKVLHYKYRAGLNDLKPIQLENLYEDLHTASADLLDRELFTEAITLVKNENGLIPLSGLDTLKLASVSLGYGELTHFQDRMAYYAPIDQYSLPKEASEEQMQNLLKKLGNYNMVIVSVQNTSISAPARFGISDQMLKFITSLSGQQKIILDIFASPYALNLFDGLAGIPAIVLSYQEHPLAQDLSAQLIFGGIPALGHLPVSASPSYVFGDGLSSPVIRLKYTIPEELAIDRKDLDPIDSTINECISRNVFPGCQVWAAKDGKVFFMKSYGNQTYEKPDPVNDFDLYDIASITKIAASVPSVMKLSDEKRLDIDQVLVHYLPYTMNTNKESLVIREMMAHQSRLQPWIPFYQKTLMNGKPDTSIYSPEIKELFPVRVAENLYIRKNYRYEMMDSILKSPLLPTSSYKYSDLGYFFIYQIVQNISNQPFEQYTYQNFYKPLGLSTMGFLPRYRFPLSRLVPTEKDNYFRMQLIHGDVHDPATAMLGGVAGHAGLFSNANDLGVLMEMYLENGSYGGRQYFQASTIKEFTSRQFPLNDNRRGIGFDKPMEEFDENGPNCESASPKSFGHSGFTGCYAWADPENGLVYIFLSNRVYPTETNNKLSQWNIRTNIHQIFYDAIKKSTTFVAH